MRRRVTVLFLVAALGLGGCMLARFDPEDPRHGPTLREAAAALDATVTRLLRQPLARRDGYVYTMDLAPLLLFMAERGDRERYDVVHRALLPLVRQAPQDPLTDGFVLWRHRANAAPEVTGAAEMLWVARALWAGGRAFARPDDTALALKILAGYARHATERHGLWYVPKYFAFANRSFAPHSVLAAYHPDFLAAVGAEQPAGPWRTLAERSYETLRRARSAGGLLHPVIEPLLEDLYPGAGFMLHAPNDVAALAESCEGAAGAVAGAPRLASGVLGVIDDDAWVLSLPYAHFRARDGAPVGPETLPTTGYACLALLAAALRDGSATRRLEPMLRRITWELASLPSAQEAPLYAAGPLLLAARALGAFDAER